MKKFVIGLISVATTTSAQNFFQKEALAENAAYAAQDRPLADKCEDGTMILSCKPVMPKKWKDTVKKCMKDTGCTENYYVKIGKGKGIPFYQELMMTEFDDEAAKMKKKFDERIAEELQEAKWEAERVANAEAFAIKKAKEDAEAQAILDAEAAENAKARQAEREMEEKKEADQKIREAEEAIRKAFDDRVFHELAACDADEACDKEALRIQHIQEWDNNGGNKLSGSSSSSSGGSSRGSSGGRGRDDDEGGRGGDWWFESLFESNYKPRQSAYSTAERNAFRYDPDEKSKHDIADLAIAIVVLVVLVAVIIIAIMGCVTGCFGTCYNARAEAYNAKKGNSHTTHTQVAPVDDSQRSDVQLVNDKQTPSGEQVVVGDKVNDVL